MLGTHLEITCLVHPDDSDVFVLLLAHSPGGGGGGTSIHYLYGYVPPKGVVILKLLI